MKIKSNGQSGMTSINSSTVNSSLLKPEPKKVFSLSHIKLPPPEPSIANQSSFMDNSNFKNLGSYPNKTFAVHSSKDESQMNISN